MISGHFQLWFPATSLDSKIMDLFFNCSLFSDFIRDYLLLGSILIFLRLSEIYLFLISFEPSYTPAATVM